MDPVSLTIALVPLAIYLLLLGALNLGRRPHVIPGGLDVATLAAGLLGLVIVGPMNLFLPDPSGEKFGQFVWPLLVVFYALCVTLYVLLARPRLIVFNVPFETLRDVLLQIAVKLDSGAKVAGDAVHLPSLGVQFHLDSVPTMRSATLKATGDRQSHSGWSRLQRELESALKGVEVSPNPRGFSFVAIALVLLGWPLLQLAQMPSNLISQRLNDILRM